MAAIFRNPRLADYFVEAKGVRVGRPAAELPSVVADYEASKVVTFPKLKLDLDLAFWASLPSEGVPALRKLMVRGEELKVKEADRDAIAPDLLARIQRELSDLYRQIMPVYEAVFAGYVFRKRQSVARLNTVMNSDMHIDTYDTELPDQMARMFVNLDDQPRIWQTSYTIEEIFERFGGEIPREAYAGLSNVDLWKAFRKTAFTGDPLQWWDERPRHVVYFQPGEVWAVDSRQVAHQIFYGRRALSIDFTVAAESMRDPSRHYLAMLDRFRRNKLAEAQT